KVLRRRDRRAAVIHMTFLEAAIEVLRLEPEPLHFSEIVKRAVSRKLLSHVGRDPVAAMQASLNAAIRGDSALLVRSKPGYFQLRPGAVLPPAPEPEPEPEAPAQIELVTEPEVAEVAEVAEVRVAKKPRAVEVLQPKPEVDSMPTGAPQDVAVSEEE